MTPQTILLSLGAGLVSAIVFASATTGPALARFALFFLTPFAIYLAGLGLGPIAGIIAGVTATALIFLIANPAAAAVFLISEAGPAVMLSRQALLARGDDNEREWFPTGHLVRTAALFAGASAVLVMTLLATDSEAMTKALRAAVETFAKTEMPTLPGGAPLTEAQLDELTAYAKAALPIVLAISAMATMLLNLWLAGRVTLASGRLTRPWPDLTSMTLPSGSSLVMLAALTLSFADGPIGLGGKAFAGAYFLSFVLMGLAVAHHLTRGSPWRNFLLTAVYVSLLIFASGAALLLALTGLAETIFKYRAHPRGQHRDHLDKS